MTTENVSKKMSRSAGRVFDEIAHELSNGKKITLIDVFDAIAKQKEVVKKFVKDYISKK